ncbi:RICIN domain-containing protein [Streptomyces sp. NPDC048506]|uniref:RICIN domain-containing protein n=1 Tax=Streptomyces sp. NPDC048506 TaxID=3155028 RepID=UPI00341B561C
MIMPALSQHSLPARAAARMLVALVAALGIIIAPLTATVAHADSGTSKPHVIISSRNNGDLSFDAVPADWSVLAPTWMIKDEPDLTIDSTADGSFNLRSDFGGCLAEQSDTRVFVPAACPASGTWTLQPASDGSNYFLIRHVGDNKCLTAYDLSNTAAVELGTCDGGNTMQQWSITTSDGTKLPDLTNGAAINLGSNTITVCNWGGYAARATIDYQIKENPADDTVTTGHYAIESFPVDQCRTATLPAGKIVATVTLRRYTDYYLGAYAFWDGDAGAYANDGNDKITAVYTLGGVHANATYHMYGTTCDSSSGFTQTSDSQMASTNQHGQVGCTDSVDAGTIANAVSAAGSLLTQFIFSLVFP